MQRATSERTPGTNTPFVSFPFLVLDTQRLKEPSEKAQESKRRAVLAVNKVLLFSDLFWVFTASSFSPSPTHGVLEPRPIPKYTEHVESLLFYQAKNRFMVVKKRPNCPMGTLKVVQTVNQRSYGSAPRGLPPTSHSSTIISQKHLSLFLNRPNPYFLSLSRVTVGALEQILLGFIRDSYWFLNVESHAYICIY